MTKVLVPCPECGASALNQITVRKKGNTYLLRHCFDCDYEIERFVSNPKQTQLKFKKEDQGHEGTYDFSNITKTKAIIESNYQKLIEKGYRCCFCGKKDVGLLFDSPFTFVRCRNTNCSPSYRWIMRIPNDNLEVFDIIPRKKGE